MVLSTPIEGKFFSIFSLRLFVPACVCWDAIFVFFVNGFQSWNTCQAFPKIFSLLHIANSSLSILWFNVSQKDSLDCAADIFLLHKVSPFQLPGTSTFYAINYYISCEMMSSWIICREHEQAPSFFTYFFKLFIILFFFEQMFSVKKIETTSSLIFGPPPHEIEEA